MKMNRTVAMWSVAGLMAVSSIGAIGAGVHAQDGAKLAGASDAARRTAWGETLVDVRFSGGSVDEYIKALAKAAGPSTVNVVYNGDAEHMRLPALALTQVSIRSAVEMLNQVQVPGSSAVRARAVSTSQQEIPVYIVEPAPGRALGETTTAVLSLNDLIALSGKDIKEASRVAEAALSAIEMAVNVSSQPGTPVMGMKFHPESGILIASGSKNQCETATRVLETMVKDARARQQEASPLRQPGTQTFALSSAPASGIAQAIRTVFPARPGDPSVSPLEIRVDDRTNSITVTAQEGQRAAVAGIIALLDRNEKPAAVREAEAQLKSREMEMKMLEEALRRHQDELAKANARAQEQIAATTDQLAKARSDLEVAKVNREATTRQLADLEVRLASTVTMLTDAKNDAEATRRQLTAKIEELTRENEALKKK